MKKNACITAVLASLCCASVALGQDYSAVAISTVVSSAQTALSRGNYGAAIPPLKEIVSRAIELPGLEGKTTLQKCRFQLARSYFQTGQPAEATTVLKDYLDDEPRPDERLALRFLAQLYFQSQEWAEIETVASRLLAIKNLPDADVQIGNMMLGQAYYRQEMWDEAISPLTLASKKMPKGRDRRSIEIMIVRALVQTGQFDEVFAWVPELYRTDAKYDITLNITLMNAGKARFDEQDYLNALLLYRMVLPREEIIAFQEQFIGDLKKELAKAQKSKGTKAGVAEKEAEITQLEELVVKLKELPPYEDEVIFRMGSIYKDVKRYWEGYVLFDELYQKDASSDLGEASMLQSVFILKDMALMDRAAVRIIKYLEDTPDGDYRRSLLSMLMGYYLNDKQAKKVIALRNHMEATPPSANPDETLLQAELHYMLAFSYLQEQEIVLAGEQFGIIVDNFQNSQFVPDSTYYRGMTFMLAGDYRSALDYFLLYQANYKVGAGGELGEHFEVSIYRQGVCLFGLQEIPQAERCFTRFIEFAPTHELVSEAYSMRGDIEAAKVATHEDPHTLERAILDYRIAMETSTAVSQASYAAFQAAKVFQLEGNWDEIIEVMGKYLAQYGEEANIAKATYWIGLSQLEKGEVRMAIDSYIDAIKRFGSDIEQEGVDKIIVELVGVVNSLEEADYNEMIAALRAHLASLDDTNQVLRLRLEIALAMIAGDEALVVYADELLPRQNDLSITTPLALSILCEAATRSGDLEKMEALYQDFVKRFPDSESIWQADRMRVAQLIKQQDLEAALEVVDNSQSVFGTEPYMGWAQIRRGELLLMLGRADEAFEAYQMVQGVNEWRSTVFAEAMYGMGMSKKAQQDYVNAFIYLNRTSLLYKARDGGKWAAMAYLEAAECLVAVDQTEDAIKTLEELIADPDLSTRPEAETAKEMLKKYKGA